MTGRSDDELEAAAESSDPHLVLIADALQGQRATIRLLVVALLAGQAINAILSGASLAAELGWIRIGSVPAEVNAERAEDAETGAGGGAVVEPAPDP